jgi:hypothetical protein
MRFLRAALLLCGVLALLEIAYAGDMPTPRAPVGPQSREMLPDRSDSQGGINTRGSTANNTLINTVPPDRVRIQNIGDQTLSLSNWDGQSWRTSSIGAGQTLDIVCVPCGTTINIAFHDGREVRTVPSTTGTTYVLGWSQSAGAWNLVARQPTTVRR